MIVSPEQDRPLDLPLPCYLLSSDPSTLLIRPIFFPGHGTSTIFLVKNLASGEKRPPWETPLLFGILPVPPYSSGQLWGGYLSAPCELRSGL